MGRCLRQSSRPTCCEVTSFPKDNNNMDGRTRQLRSTHKVPGSTRQGLDSPDWWGGVPCDRTGLRSRRPATRTSGQGPLPQRWCKKVTPLFLYTLTIPSQCAPLFPLLLMHTCTCVCVCVYMCTCVWGFGFNDCYEIESQRFLQETMGLGK